MKKANCQDFEFKMKIKSLQKNADLKKLYFCPLQKFEN